MTSKTQDLVATNYLFNPRREKKELGGCLVPLSSMMRKIKTHDGHQMPFHSIMRRKKTWWLQGALLIQKEKNKELSGHQVPFSLRTRKKKHLVAIK
jgi:hypothetical protein